MQKQHSPCSSTYGRAWPYVPVYAAGIPYLRSAIWVVSFWGIVKLVRALLGI